MAFLHCHNCDWSQDDFWEKDGYTPFRQDIVDFLKKTLFEERAYFGKFVFEEVGFKDDQIHHDDHGWWVKGTDWVAKRLEQKAESIRNMNVKTSEEWKGQRESWKCPECGSDEWDID